MSLFVLFTLVVLVAWLAIVLDLLLICVHLLYAIFIDLV